MGEAYVGGLPTPESNSDGEDTVLNIQPDVGKRE